MNETYLGVSFFLLSAFSLIMSVSVMVRKRFQPAGEAYALLALIVAGWALVSGLYHLAGSAAEARVWLLARNAVDGFLPVGVFAYAMVIMGRERSRIQTEVLLCGIMPAMTALLVATSAFHPLIFTELQVTYADSFKTVDYQAGFWLWMQMLYTAGLALFSVGMMVKKLLEVPRPFRMKQVAVLMTLLFFVVSGVVRYKAIGWGPVPVFLNSSLLLCLLSLYLLSFHVKTTDFVALAHTKLFKELTSLVFILSSDRVVMDVNYAASNAFGMKTDELIGENFDELFLQWMSGSDGTFESAGGLREISIPDGAALRHYELSELVLHDQRGCEVGVIVEISDITHFKSAIMRLESMVSRDTLTGLLNRRAYKSELRRLSSQEYLPLAIVIGDLDNLKGVNDAQGHEMGDRLLMATAEILRKSCRGSDIIARTGGDEFILLLPNTEELAVHIIMDRIRQACAAASAAPDALFTVSISLGYGLLLDTHTDIQQVINEADLMMYSEKNLKKRQISF